MDWSQHSIPAMRLEPRFGDRIVPAFCERPKSIPDMVAEAVARNGDGEALVCGATRLTWREVARQSAQIAAGFQKLGLQRGDRVAVLLGNRIEFVLTMLGAAHAGLVTVLLSTRQQKPEIAYVLTDCGARMAETIAFLSERGVPVMGHIGLTPQSINTLGSFRAQGREEGSWEPIENDANAIAQAGAFSVVIEAVAEPLARKITETIAIPTIGIGASAACDGQVLVLEDMLGLSPRTPKFVRRYGDLGPMIEAAIEGYARDVRSRAFPGPEHVYGMKKS